IFGTQIGALPHCVVRPQIAAASLHSLPFRIAGQPIARAQKLPCPARVSGRAFRFDRAVAFVWGHGFLRAVTLLNGRATDIRTLILRESLPRRVSSFSFSLTLLLLTPTIPHVPFPPTTRSQHMLYPSQGRSWAFTFNFAALVLIGCLIHVAGSF